VLNYATAEGRALLTLNRRHFVKLHQANPVHFGIIVCAVDSDFSAQAMRVHAEIEKVGSLPGTLVRVNRG